ncbi:hypothetical protein K402DRAFT_392493 [Aulographum hederae CBS 113979]|uniref:Uncharacterized protein n=1 Tax=Aulographum hederae CBS 113979 TaxID=1176131 RepID=A0A6G1H3V6_9PEZI|nr:hypothetical protein K402DRAFT_392493 [Aulographum hederae CBS 113979]
MSGLSKPRNLLLAAGAVGAVVYMVPGNIFHTPATKSVGERWSKGGGSDTHTPAMATPLGSAEQTTPRSNIKAKGPGTPHFENSHGDQIPGQQPTSIGKQWNQAHYGNDKGK